MSPKWNWTAEPAFVLLIKTPPTGRYAVTPLSDKTRAEVTQTMRHRVQPRKTSFKTAPSVTTKSHRLLFIRVLTDVHLVFKILHDHYLIFGVVHWLPAAWGCPAVPTAVFSKQKLCCHPQFQPKAACAVSEFNRWNERVRKPLSNSEEGQRDGRHLSQSYFTAPINIFKISTFTSQRRAAQIGYVRQLISF